MYVTFSKDKVMNFKKYLYAFAAVLMTVIAPSCVKDGFGEPMISTDNSTYEIPLEGGEVKVMLTSTRSWTARVFPATSLDDIEGIVVEPASGEASSEPIEVTIKATANASYPRAALISFETSVVSAAVTVNQDGPVARPAAELTVAEFLKKEVDASIYYKLTGTIKNLKNTEYGNFDLVDETGSVYVYGLTTEKTGSNDKSFSKLGLKEGDVLTLEGTRAAYNGVAQVGGPAYYISHVAGDAPADPAPVAMTIAEAVAQTDSVLVSGTVMALCAKGFILQDESGVAFIYDTKYSQTYSVGDQVKVGGKPGAYNYANQITPNAKYYEKTGSIEVTYPDPVVLNAAKVAEMKDGAGADKNVGVYNPFYITVEGTVRVSGNYFNLDIDGVETSTAQGSFYQLTDAQKEELTALKDKAVVLTGYFQSISQSSGVPKFFNVIYLTVEEKEAEGGEEPTEKTARNLAFLPAAATATLGQDFTAPTLNGVTDGVAYSSSNTEVATVDAATGVVTLVAAGETTITATAAETETLQAGSASYTLTVSAAAVEPVGPLTVTIAEFLAAEVSNTQEYQLTGVMSGTYNTTYGNFYLEDATAKVLVYGLTATKQTSNDKSFETLGLRDGDTVTLIGKRDDHNGTAQVGGPAYYVSHVAAPYVDFAIASATVEADVTTYSIEFESNVAWAATASEGVTVSPASGEGDGSVVMTFAANTSNDPIDYTVTFTSSELTKTFTLTQKGVPADGAEPRYVKVTAVQEDWSGKYLIVFGNNAHATLSSKDLIATKAVSVVAGEIAATSDLDAAVMTVSKEGGKYVMKYPDGKYFSMAKNSSSSSTSSFELTFTYTTSGVKIAGVASGTTYILYHNSNNGNYYRCYVDKNGQSGYNLPTLYKYTE